MSLEAFFAPYLSEGREVSVELKDAGADRMIAHELFLSPSGLVLRAWRMSRKRVVELPVTDIVLWDRKAPGAPLTDAEAPPFAPPLPGKDRALLSVGEVTRRVREKLESPDLTGIWVTGEVSSLRPAPSGHLYFILKDADATLSAVMWAAKAKGIVAKLREGMQVEVKGSLGVYAARGSYQIICDVIRPQGTGDLALAFEELKRRLGKEGLFDPDRKRPLPPYARTIALVTSPTGAVLRDMLTTTRRLFPGLHLKLYPTAVQGAGSAEQLAKAIRQADLAAENELIIVARGGGSAEDLQAFNEEVLVRAVAGTRLPVISAVGHETDFTLCDFAADERAATPTAAAERITSGWKLLAEETAGLEKRMASLLRGRLERFRGVLEGAHRDRLGRLLRRCLDEKVQAVDEMALRLPELVRRRHERVSQNFVAVAGKLHALSPFHVLARGYSQVRKDGVTVTDAEALAPGDEVEVRFHKGRRVARVES